MLLCKNKAKKWSDFILRDNKLKTQKIWEARAKSMMKSCTKTLLIFSPIFGIIWKKSQNLLFILSSFTFPIMNALVFFDYRPGHSLGGIFFRTKWKNCKYMGFHILKVLEGFHWNILSGINLLFLNLLFLN